MHGLLLSQVLAQVGIAALSAAAPDEIGLMKGEDGRPAALLVRTKGGDETQLITYDANIKIELPAP